MIEAVGDSPALAVTDRHGTWSHVAFSKAMSKAGKAPIFGVELAIVEKIERERHPANYMAFLARNNAGLQELYELVTEATADGNFYYFPRLDYHRVKSVSQNLIVLSGTNPIWELLNQKQKNLYIELSPSSRRTAVDFARASKRPLVATSDNYYPTFEHKAVYEIIAGRNRDSRTTPMHILDQWEWMNYWPEQESAWKLTAGLAAECTATIPKAQNVKYNSPKTLEQMCIEAAPARRIDLASPIYKARLRRELDMIAEKDFADYFFVIADMLQYAKKHMMVGPARGSSCGSLVCYLLSITEIDPIPFDLLFERFIDINRKDLPDIDIDFADDRRDMVFDYVRNKYGDNCVARLGTIMRYKAKSAIDAVAVSLRIDKAKTENLKGSIIERSGGDARAAFCILDTFNELEVGKEMLREFPHLRIAADIENHAKTTGQHAAGIVITQEPISRFCSMNLQSGAVMVDKFDAESVNLLKIDALGLRTLSVIQDCLDQIGKSREWLMEYPLGDEDAFDVVNNSRFAGIFQFEGYALQSLCQQMRVENFEDIASLGALARPGPLNSGGANEFIKRRTGQHPVEYLHPLCKEMTEVTYGIVIYQEQVMTIARVVGQLSWEDVSSLRKAMSKSMGVEFFDKFWVRFLDGAIKQGISEPEARKVWEQINTMGSWSFNRSHAVAYGMVTYWCMVLKAHWPLEWAVACLRNASSDDQCIKLLRELDSEGFKYRDFDPELSKINWSVHKGELIGGLLNVKGIGAKKAKDVMERRADGRGDTPAMKKMLTNAQTPFSYDKVFECRVRFGPVLACPTAFNIHSKIWRLIDITSEMEGDFVFFGKMVKKDLRDLNEPLFIQKRGGEYETGQTLFLNMTVEDDTSSILTSINRRDYLDIGKPIVEIYKIGDWFLWKGRMRKGFRKVYIQRYWPGSKFDIPFEQTVIYD